jgi:hypothetical protein
MFTANDILAKAQKEFVAFSELCRNKLGGTDLEN